MILKKALPNRSEKDCIAAVLRHGANITYLTPDQRSIRIVHLGIEMSLLEVSLRKWGLRYLGELQTPELCFLAVSNCGLALGAVFERFKTVDLCYLAVQKDGWALKYVPEHLCSLDLCRIAVEGDGRALGFVPLPLRISEICLLAVKQAIQTIQKLYEHSAQYQLMKVLKHVPEAERTPELCSLVIEHGILEDQYVSEKLYPEICYIAYQRLGDKLKASYCDQARRYAYLCEEFANIVI